MTLLEGMNYRAQTHCERVHKTFKQPFVLAGVLACSPVVADHHQATATRDDFTECALGACDGIAPQSRLALYRVAVRGPVGKQRPLSLHRNVWIFDDFAGVEIELADKEQGPGVVRVERHRNPHTELS